MTANDVYVDVPGGGLGFRGVGVIQGSMFFRSQGVSQVQGTAYITVLSSLARVLYHALTVLFAAMLTRSLLRKESLVQW